jgi:hypothetical protein
MIIKSDHIISRKLWKPFIRLFWHGIGISRNGGHVQGFVEIIFPRLSHWSKGKGTLEKGFDNMRLERRTYLVNLRRCESPWGKSINGRWILGRWSHHMSFKRIS